MSRFVIYWWAETENPRKRGHDEIELAQEELDKWEADDILTEKAQCERPAKYPGLPNFEGYYPIAAQCISFGVVKVVKKPTAIEPTEAKDGGIGGR